MDWRDTLEGLSWLLDRGVQARNQAIQAGLQESQRIRGENLYGDPSIYDRLNYYQPGVSTKTMTAALGGALRGLTGTGKDVSSQKLFETEGHGTWGNEQLRGLMEGLANYADMISPSDVVSPGGRALAVPVHSAIQRRKLARAVPEYAALVESLGGVGQNAKRLGKEALDWLIGALPNVGKEMAEAVATVPAKSEKAYRPFLHELLGKHGAIVPYIPKSKMEPLVVKTTAPNINHLWDRLFESSLLGPASGVYKPMWTTKARKAHPYQKYASSIEENQPIGGDLIMSRVKDQELTLGHEHGHLNQDKLTDIYTRMVGARPRSQKAIAQAKFYRPVNKKWVPLDPESTIYPEIAYNYMAKQVYKSLPDAARRKLAQDWDMEEGQRLYNEAISELIDERSMAKRLRGIPGVQGLDDPANVRVWRDTMAKRHPGLGSFISYTKESVDPRAFYLPGILPTTPVSELERGLGTFAGDWENTPSPWERLK